MANIEKRVVVIHWKKRQDITFEVFSNLKNLCLSYPKYNYNTLNNYLGKAKTAYENDDVRIERKNIFTEPKNSLMGTRLPGRSIVPVVHKAALKDTDESFDNLAYWSAQPPVKRVAAVTFIISQSLQPGERLNKNIVNRKKMNS
ncbi:hypothetical protein [Chitinophaga varians]|uniref:hypothetical protein n=1 Tax=Chitinophaga varians TaxID=2202339 RepID=UPI00165ED7C7|nr:hypothetical protein [Chitinophaga varians]MBC9909371.1 hypothetical protein [Chitinophaga varians]